MAMLSSFYVRWPPRRIGTLPAIAASLPSHHSPCPPCPGLVNVRKNVGGGSFLAGYKRHLADYSSFEVRSLRGVQDHFNV